MGKLNTTVMALMMTLVCCMRMAIADPIVSSGGRAFSARASRGSTPHRGSGQL